MTCLDDETNIRLNVRDQQSRTFFCVGWKGMYMTELEQLAMDGVVSRLGVARWDLFADLDSTFEDIAAGAADRFSRSQV